MILNEIVEHKRKEIEELKRLMPFTKIKEKAEQNVFRRRSLQNALTKGKGIHLICELKKASPSEGILRQEFEPQVIVQEFEAAGASAISVLTERHYFQGNPKTLKQIRPLTSVPLLRKDFIFDPYQVYETALLKADAFLIIAMLVSDQELKTLLQIATQLQLETLVEVHSKAELDRAIHAGSQLIGINNRNLKTLEIDRSISENLIKFVPKTATVVIESGIETQAEITRYHALGAHCFLIGTALMKSKNIQQKITELYGPSSGVSSWLK
ncbi:MAG: indole-3-glycerol phosphate synthase TrpC [Candidatus Omnitrophica bacterium]|nr:indole-3-glycerol phosphate synthase TrpC [Candidatus Omnitrophota bacterium]